MPFSERSPGSWPPLPPSQRSVRRHIGLIPIRRTRPRLCPGRIGVRSGLRPQPLGDGGDFRRPDRPARNPAALDAGKAREARRFCRRCHGRLRGPRTRRPPRLGDQARATTQRGNVLTQKSPRAGGPRGSIAIGSCLVDDLDDPARARLDNHAAFVDYSIVIFSVARHRPQHDRVRQRLADHHLLANHD